MRTFTRKLLSLLLAFTMVCAMVPAALAVDGDGTGTTTGGVGDVETGGDDGNNENEPTKPPEGHNGEGTHTEATDWSKNDSKHWHACTVTECTYKYGEKEHVWGEGEITTQPTCEEKGIRTYTCECGATKTEDIAATGHSIPSEYTTTPEQHSYICSKCSEPVSEDHKFNSNGRCSVCYYDNIAPIDKVSIDKGSFTMDINDKSVSLGYTVRDEKGNVTTTKPTSVSWSSSNRWVADVSSSGVVYPEGVGTAKITVTVNGTVEDSIVVTVEADADLDVTIYEGMGTYYFSDEDADGVSLEDQLYDALEDAGYDYDDDDLSFSISDKKSSVGTISYDDEDEDDVYYFGDVAFTIEKAGTFTTTYKVYDRYSTILSGSITIEVEEGGSVGDIIYTAKNGEDVEFDVDDFEDFWDDNSSKGSLDYVMFDSVSSSKGDLVDNEGDDVSTKTKYYVDPGSKQIDLDGITFEPARNLKTAVTIGFTAYGTNKKSVSGTVVILYTEKEPEAIVYNSTGKNITLDADDFLDNYKDTVGSSASNIQIQFLDAPSNGTLYYNYNEKTEKGTELTSKNVQNYTFSTNTRASRSIEDVTYVPDSRGRTDTIKFAAYTSSGELRYYGEVTFGQTVQNVSVSMTSTSAGVTFQTSSFTGADSAMLTVSSISFGTPSSGTLYKNWTGTSGTRVTASDMFSYVASVTGNPSLSTVTYVPVAGYSGNVTIPFSAYSTTGNSIINGTVTIRVTATTTTTVFTDVPTTGSQAWAAPYISRLYSAGVVGGVTATTYGPKQAVKWGEALKMVLRGAGYPAQTEGTGSNWAANYLTYAYNNGLVSSNSIDLNSNITRLEMAELAAKALKMSPASRINSGIVGPTDTTNGYVYALYNAGIVGGDSSSGQNRYNGGSSLNRDEMAKIVCGVMDYNG